jgi:hypothetical protein
MIGLNLVIVYPAEKIVRKTVCLATISLLGIFSGCAGPSKTHLVRLLGECRASNREHLRLLREYQTVAEQCNAKHPEQIQNQAEFDLGGF